MSLNLPFEVLYILYLLQKHGFGAFLVGGAVRDLVSNLQADEIKDFDFTTDATPEQIQQFFPESFYENKFGTVSVTEDHLLEELGKIYQLPEKNRYHFIKPAPVRSNRIIDLANAKKIHVSLQDRAVAASQQAAPASPNLPAFEITTFRSDGDYTDHRRPETVTFGTSIEQDLERRDFTINALAIELDASFLQNIFGAENNSAEKKEIQTFYKINPNDYKLIDLHGGKEDLDKRLVRTVGNPDQRFGEDALRMLRAVRLAIQLNMDIETDTYFAIKFHKDSLRFVSGERIRDEFMKILASDHPAEGIELLDQTGLLEQIIPELYDGIDMQQRGHHTTDVWTHSIDALRYCPSPDPIVRLATLLHDIGKPDSYKDDQGEITFYSHDIFGSRTASRIANRLRLSKKDVQRIFILVRYHMFHYQEYHTDASIRRFIKRVGFEHIDDILDLREGDRLGSGARKTSWRLEEMKARVIEQLNQPMGLDDLDINGHDLMEKLGIKPGPVLGRLLDQLLELVLEKPELNEKEKLVEEAKKIVEGNTKINP